MTTNLGIDTSKMNETVGILHKHLATEIVFNLKIRNFHWNVVGIHFNDLHKFFEDLYNTGADYADEIAERIRMLGHHTHASMGEYIKMTYIAEEKDIKMDSDKMLQQLLVDNETIIREMRKDILTVAASDDM
jgi:starvation-inducible DNA-binding protein